MNIAKSCKGIYRVLRTSVFIVALLAISNIANAAKYTIGIVIYDNVLTSDVVAPLEVFGIATKQAWFSNYEVISISPTREKTIKTEEGLTMVADKTIYDDMKLDVLLVGSAYDMKPYVGNKDFINFIKEQDKHTLWTASNCSGSSLLAEAGVLDGKKATTWAGGEKEFADKYKKVDVQYDSNVVVDDGVITSNGSVVSYQAALVLLEKLSSKKFSTEVADVLQYGRLKSVF